MRPASPSRRRARLVSHSVLAGLAIAVASGSATAQSGCVDESIGVTPLDDMRTHAYAPFVGGLYDGGVNVRPDSHDKSGRTIASRIVPLGADGKPSDTGVIGVAAIGFSITGIVFDVFQALAAADPGIDPSVRPVNCASPLFDADDLADPASPYWSNEVPDALAAASLAANQVQVVWILTGRRFQTEPYPGHVDSLELALEQIVRNVRANLPNCVIGLVSSLPYMGYAKVYSADEPYWFEQGFALRSVILRQIAGDPSLNWDPELGETVAPWLAWGPYYWTDGVEPRSDGLFWECSDADRSGAHPSAEGAEKLAERLLHCLESDPVATPWFLADPGAVVGRPAEVELIGEGTVGTGGALAIHSNQLPTIPTATDFELHVRNGASGASGFLLLGTSLLAGDGMPFADGSIYVAPSLLVPLWCDSKGHAPLSFDPIPDDPALGEITFFGQAVTYDLGASHGFALTPAIELVLGD
jgi:hypothetical protein